MTPQDPRHRGVENFDPLKIQNGPMYQGVMTPRCPMYRGVETPWGPLHRRVETPRGPMHQGVTKVDPLKNPKWSYAPVSCECDSPVSCVPGSQDSQTKLYFHRL